MSTAPILCFQLTLCYVVGKTWEAMTFGFGTRADNHTAYALVALKWQLVAGLFAIMHSMWELMTQRYHAELHSPKCVCTACAPEYYEDAKSGEPRVYEGDACDDGDIHI